MPPEDYVDPERDYDTKPVALLTINKTFSPRGLDIPQGHIFSTGGDMFLRLEDDKACYLNDYVGNCTSVKDDYFKKVEDRGPLEIKVNSQNAT